MTKEQLTRQSKTLLAHGLDNQGRIQPKIMTSVVKAVAGSGWPNKRALLRQMLHDVANIERQQTAVITTSREFSEGEKQELTESLLDKYPSVSTFNWQEDKKLLAGLTVQVGDMWHDLSVKQRLVQVQERLR